jgi:hypothetical protein
MPPPAQSTQPPGQQLPARENSHFKKLVVCYFIYLSQINISLSVI